ncbi:hypothetical protein OMCYN_01369 [cyanobiont of Ornithocercus magnificus]|nr:hypothetical protein OMCYN_01369 [cyanobiont of Ornithocercus magnificus]
MVWIPSERRQYWSLPVWTPGSYTVRDHAQYLHCLKLSQLSTPVNVRRRSPSKWIADVESHTPVELYYRVEARQLTVRTCYLDPGLASLCLSSLAMLIDGHRWEVHYLSLKLPSHWSATVPLPLSGDDYVASSFDQLVDSPVHAGILDLRPFEVKGHRHLLVLYGEPPRGWPISFLDDVAAICQATCSLMKDSPPAGNGYQIVLLLLDSGYGGLEHDNSSVLHFSWLSLGSEKGYRQLLQLIGHEYLHQWNVRRLRPQEFLPYDYDRAVVSDGLWFAEGITSYFDLFLPLITGHSDQLTALRDLSTEVSWVLTTPGRKVQSLADSSREAWIKLYKAVPPSADVQISYYRLGTALAFCLDIKLRCTGSSLAELLRTLYETYGRCQRGFCRRDIEQQLSALGHQNIAEQLADWLDQPDNLPLQEAVSVVGLQLHPVYAPRRCSGLQLKLNDGIITVVRVVAGSAAQTAGVIAGDELLAVAGYRIRRPELLPELIPDYGTCELHLCRRGRILTVSLNPNSPKIDRWEISYDPKASSKAVALREQWFQII